MSGVYDRFHTHAVHDKEYNKSHHTGLYSSYNDPFLVHSRGSDLYIYRCFRDYRTDHMLFTTLARDVDRLAICDLQ